MKIRFIICLSILITVSNITSHAQHQQTEYTYVSENQFLDIKDLNNFTFSPSKVDMDRLVPVSIKSRKLKIHISEEKVHFAGVSKLGSHPIISKSRSLTGYDYLINLGALEFKPAHLKVVLDDNHHAHIIYFHSEELGALTFHLPYKSDVQFKRDSKYYTSRKDLSVKDFRHLLAKKIIPYYIAEDRQVYDKQNIDKRAKLSFYFDEDRFSFNQASESEYNEIKKVKKSKVNIPNMPRVKYCLELSPEAGDSGCHIYIDKDQKISVIEYKGNLYFLLP